MKEELEYIWKYTPLAFANHIAGWLSEEKAKERGKGFFRLHEWWTTLVRIRGRKVHLPPVKRIKW